MDCNHHHLPMENSDWPSSSHPMDELNNALDPITVLTDADLQNELSLYATTQFTFDGLLSNMPVEDKSIMVNHMNIHPSTHSNHYHRPNLVINTMNNNNNGDAHNPCSSTISSPYDLQQHYFTPISSLPTSPMLNDLGDHQQMSNPLLSLLLSPTSQHQHLHPYPQNFSILEPDAHFMHRSISSASNGMVLNDTHSLSSTTTTKGISIDSNECTKKRPAARYRSVSGGGTPSTITRGRPRRRQQPRQTNQNPASMTATGTTQQSLVDDHDNIMDLVTSDPLNNTNDDDGPDDLIPFEYNATTTTEPTVRPSKRQRNTEASARFRIKKKMREQSLQRTACEMTNKANFMENKVHELEREIKWLKALLVAKDGCSYC